MAQIRAFAEAEGFGAYATGARTNLASATVYRVTNLNDSGSGSFRDAVSQPNRFVVFDVSGVINITSTVAVSSNITIAGQTAPGGGITIYGSKVSFSGAHNTVARYLRIRKGTTTDRDDAVSIANGTNMIFDHMSITWGNDETFSINPSSGATTDKITIQNTIIGQGLDNVNHSAGGLIQPNGGVSILRSLFIDNETRNPKAKGNLQFVNNVVYNWTTAAYIMGGDSSGEHWANAQSNYFIQGPLSGSAAFTGGNTDYHIYADNNYYDSNRNGALDGRLLTQADYGSCDWLTTPNPYPSVNIETPQDAYARIISYVGPSLYRDQVDLRMIQELSSLGTLGQIVIRETDLYPGYPYTLPSSPPPTDTDNDGIPDSWEIARGLDPNNPADWKNLHPTGHTWLELYINELASVHADKVWTASSGAWNTSGNWSGGTPIWDDNAFVKGNGPGTNGLVTVASPGAKAFRLFIGGNGDAAGEKVALNSGGSLWVMDTIQVGHQNNGILEVNSGGTVEADSILLGTTVGGTYSGSLLLNGGTIKTRVIAATGGSGTFSVNGGTLQAIANPSFAANAYVGSSGLNLDSNGYGGTFSGSISGPGAVTKWGDGAINLSGNNSFTGGVILKRGSLGISSSANIGGTSSTITFQGGLLRINGNSLTSIDTHPVNWSSFNGGFDIADASHTFTVNSNISGSGSLTKQGAGILQLNGDNSYTGGTILRAGALAITNSNNIGGAGSSISFQGGLLRIVGTGMSNHDNHAVNWSSFNGGFDIADANHTFAINQVIGGSGGLTKNGAGTLVLNAANTFTGNVIINEGALRMGHPLAIQYATLNFTGSGMLDLNGYSLSIGGIAGGGAFDLKGGTLTVGNNNLSTTFSGVISDSVGSGRLVKVGTGDLTLTNSANTMGGIIVNNGGIGFTANVSSSGASPFGTSSTGVLLDGGKLARTSTGGASWARLFTLGPGGGTLEGNTGYARFTSTGTVPFISTGNSTLTLAGNSQQDNEVMFKLVDPVGGKLSVNKTGSARWILSVASAQAWTYSGDTTINGGTLIANGGSNVLPYGPGKGNLVINAGTFDMSGRSFNINGLNGAGRVYHRNSGTVTLTLGNGDADGAFSGVISDSGTILLVKVGSGRQILSGSNSYKGATTINGGVLQFNSASSIGGTGASVTVNSGAVAAAGYAMDQSFLSRLVTSSTGAAALAANSSNSLNLSNFASLSLGAVGSVSYSGVLTPNGTTYRLGGGNGTLVLANANALTGSRSVRLVAPATVLLTNSNNYTGGTTVNAGTLIANKLSNGTLTISGGAARITAKAQANDSSGTTVVPALAIASGAVLDLTNNSMVIDYTSVGTLVDDTRQHLLNGRLTSTSADATRRLGYGDNAVLGMGSFGGQSVDSTSLLVRFTYAGDANLDGQVDITDLGSLATAWQASGPWTSGDFDYNGLIDITDLGLLATNWQAGVGSGAPELGPSFEQALAAVGLGGVAVPEPAGALVGCAVFLLFRRRK